MGEREMRTNRDEDFNRIVTARRAILDAGAKPSTRGVIECPNCKGRLHWSMAFNKHIHASCETPKCCAWME